MKPRIVKEIIEDPKISMDSKIKFNDFLEKTLLDNLTNT